MLYKTSPSFSGVEDFLSSFCPEVFVKALLTTQLTAAGLSANPFVRSAPMFWSTANILCCTCVMGDGHVHYV